MPDEVIITQLENLFNEIVELGAEKERTRMVPNLLVTNDTPTGFPDFIVVKDDRDGDNILATKVPGVIYATNDLVNVLFVRGGEAIAFQQGSQSGNSGIWEIVPGTSTDIVYAQGDVGIGKTIAPDATLEILDTTQAQLRLTHTEDTAFVNFTLDGSHDLTITPSSTGQIKLQPTTDSTDFFQVLDADGGNPVLNVDSTNERVGIGTATPGTPLHVAKDASGLIRMERTTTVDSFAAIQIRNTSTGGAHNSGIGSKAETVLANSYLYFTGDDTNIHLAVRRDGNVGIGTVAPGAPLHVSKDAAGLARLERITTVDNFAAIQIRNTSTGGAHNTGFGSKAEAVLANSYFYMTADDVNIHLAIRRDGNIGINGITAPSTELDIGAGAIEFAEMTAPGAGAVNTARLYAVDNGAGKTQLAVIFNTGAVQVLATQP